MDMFGVAVLIFLVTDPFGNIAVFLAALKGVAPGRRLRVAFRELAFALGLLLLFLTLGEHILSGLGLSREATGIAGGQGYQQRLAVGHFAEQPLGRREEIGRAHV